MAGSVNKVILVGNLGRDPEVRTMQNGGEVVNLSIATSESWKDKNSGERKEKTEWHRVVVFNSGLVNVCKNYLKKGSKVYIEGQIETRKWQDNAGKDNYSTEVVLRPYRSELQMLDSRGSSGSGSVDSIPGDFNQDQAQVSQSGGDNPFGGGQQAAAGGGSFDDLDDDIPF